MTKCLVCGKENAGWLCSECAPSCNKENLCNTFCFRHTGCGDKEQWSAFSEILNDDIAFEIIETLCDNLTDDLKTYYKILYFARNNNYIRKNNIDFFLANAENVINGSNTTIIQKNRIRGLLLDVYTNLYDYEKAEEIANLLLNEIVLPKYAICSLILYFKNTRRYEKVENVVKEFLENNSDDSYCSIIAKEYEDLEKRRDGKKIEYFPKEQPNQEKYFAFLESLGFEDFKKSKSDKADKPAKTFKKPRNIPKPIPRNEYPLPKKAEGTYYKDFVAFDVETTGQDSTKDSIVELSAVKVKDGKIVDAFSELVRPIDKKISSKATAVNNITNDDVKNAREIWEVFPEFAKFIENDILVGYNSLAFDSRCLVRAGRYSHIVLNNKHLDVMQFSRMYLRQQGISNPVSLIKLGEMLGIENPQAHRALADAETTAKIYLKLMELQA